MVNLVKVLVLLELALIPILPATGQFGFEQIKIVFFIFLTTLIGILWMVLLLQKKIKIYWTVIKLLSFCFILLLLVFSLTGVDPLVSITGRDPYFQGWVVYAYCFLLVLVISSVRINLKEASMSLLISSAFVSVVAIRQWVELNIFDLPILTYAGRVVSTFGQPNFYSGFLAMTLPFIFFLLKSHRKMAAAVILLLLLAVFTSQSRVSIVMLVLLIILFLLSQLKQRLRICLLLFGSAIIVASLVLSVIYQSGFYRKEGNIITQFGFVNYSPEKRVFIYPVIADLILKKPLFGYGLENIGVIFASNLHPEIPGQFPTNSLVDLKNLYVDRSHNYILDLLMFGGVVSLIVWLVLVFLLLFKAKGALKISLIIYLVFALFQNQSIVHLVYFWLLVELIDSKSN